MDIGATRRRTEYCKHGLCGSSLHDKALQGAFRLSSIASVGRDLDLVPCETFQDAFEHDVQTFGVHIFGDCFKMENDRLRVWPLNLNPPYPTLKCPQLAIYSVNIDGLRHESYLSGFAMLLLHIVDDVLNHLWVRNRKGSAAGPDEEILFLVTIPKESIGGEELGVITAEADRPIIAHTP